MNFEEQKRLLLSKISFECPVTAACTIEFDKKMRTTAGRANYTNNTIKLNYRLFQKHPQHLEQTFAHELAHLASYETFGNRGGGHGSKWKAFMRKFGYRPDRCHSLDVGYLARPQKVVAKARCNCKLWDVKPQRFKKMVSGANYRCKSCKTRLVLV